MHLLVLLDLTIKKTDYKLKYFIMELLQEDLNKMSLDTSKMLEDILKNILEKIATDYKMNKEELFNKYIKNKKCEESNIIGLTHKKKKRINEVPNNNRCIANTAKLTRCTKSKLDGIHFCGFHKNKQQYGVVELEEVISTCIYDEIEYYKYNLKLYMKEKVDHYCSINKIILEHEVLESFQPEGFIEENGVTTLY